MRVELSPSTKHLRYFCEVARQGSFTRAAERLSISQPTVSAGIDSLERQVGLPLFEIVNRRVLLTEAGRVLFRHAERALLELGDAERAIAGLKGAEAGRLLVGGSSTPGTYLLPRLLGQFRSTHPGVEIALEIASTGEILDRLERGRLCLALVGETSFDAGLEVELCGMDELVLVVGRDHPLATRSEARLHDLAGETLLLREPGSSTREVLLRALANHSFRPHALVELAAPEVIKKCAAACLGVAFVSRYAVETEAANGELVVIPTPELSIRRGIFLAHRGSLRLDPIQARFREQLRELMPGANGV